MKLKFSGNTSIIEKKKDKKLKKIWEHQFQTPAEFGSNDPFMLYFDLFG